jgi:hypothetical protein
LATSFSLSSKVDVDAAAAAAGLFFLDFNVESRNRLRATNEIELVAPFPW